MKVPHGVIRFTGDVETMFFRKLQIHHLELIHEPIPKLKIASLNPVFRIINRVSNHENNPKILDD